jgi:hypothetical protein
MRQILLVLVPLLTLAACHGTPEAHTPTTPDERAFATALVKMCDVDRQAGLAATGDPLGVGAKRTAWITENVGNPDVIELRTLMSVKDPADQACMLRDRAKEMGITSCALAETLARTNEGGLAP